MNRLTIMIGAVLASIAASLLFDAAPTNAHMTCGNGMTFNPAHTPTNGQPACIPANDWSAPAPSTSHGRWETRWGAFANDDTGLVGMASGMSSKGKAAKAAIAHCESRGGVNCRLRLAYFNQCAVVLGSEHSNGTWDSIFQGAATLEEASGLAERKCRTSGARNCKVVFSDCSYAEFVQ